MYKLLCLTLCCLLSVGVLANDDITKWMPPSNKKGSWNFPSSPRAQQPPKVSKPGNKTHSKSSQLPSEFFSCKFASTTMMQAQRLLSDYNPTIQDKHTLLVENLTFGGLTHYISELYFLDDKFCGISFYSILPQKNNAIQVRDYIYSVMSAHYTMTRKDIDGFKCYVTNDKRHVSSLVTKEYTAEDGSKFYVVTWAFYDAGYIQSMTKN